MSNDDVTIRSAASGDLAGVLATCDHAQSDARRTAIWGHRKCWHPPRASTFRPRPERSRGGTGKGLKGRLLQGDAREPLFRREVQDFLIDEFSYDPAALIAGYRNPVLIVQGHRDIQVGVADGQCLHDAQPKATMAVLTDTNHVLKTVTSDSRTENIATYGNPTLPLAPAVIDTVADFITRRNRRVDAVEATSKLRVSYQKQVD